MKIERVFDFFYAQKVANPTKTSLSYKYTDQWINHSFEEVVDYANLVSLFLLDLGLGKDDKIAIVSTNRPEWVFADLGIQQIGATSVPMYPTISSEDYSYIFKDAEVKVVFCETDELYQKVSTACKDTSVKHIISFNKLENVKHFKTEIEKFKNSDFSILDKYKDAVKKEDLLTLIYTSGTTGQPKGVMLTHDNIVSNANSVGEVINTYKGVRPNLTLSFLPLCHIFERTALYTLTNVGISITFAESLEKLPANIKEVKPEMFTTVPRLLEKIYDKIITTGLNLSFPKKQIFFWALNLSEKFDPAKKYTGLEAFKYKIADKLIYSKWREVLGGNLRLIVTGAAALQPRIARSFWAANIMVCECYGLTETSPAISVNYPVPDRVSIGAVGQIIRDVEVKIASDGEILVKGPNVMKGYYNKPTETAAALEGGWFHTGDVGEIFNGNYLRITDRKKEMFKTSGGKYIAPQVIENKLKESLLIEQAMVVGENQNFPGAIIVPNFENLREWAKINNLTFNSDLELINSDKVKEKITHEVERSNRGFGKWEQIKKFNLVDKPWSIETGELTPTLKLKRKIIHHSHQDLIDSLYNEK